MQHWILGALFGLIIALTIVLIMHYTIFKKNKKMAWLYISIILIFTAGGASIQYTQFSPVFAEVPSPQEQIETINKEISDNWKNTNGGFTFEEIQKAQEDNECPTFEDQIIGLKCYDFGSYIVFSYKDGNTYQNVSFYKSKNGLILDGLINMRCSMNKKGFLNLYWDTNSFIWIDERGREPVYDGQSHLFGKCGSNLVSVSRQDCDALYISAWNAFALNWNEATAKVLRESAKLTGNNASEHFIKFGNVELIGTANTGYKKINTFYNYLYEQIKNESYGTKKLIDSNSCLCLPIPQDIQNQYPIPEAKKAEYNNAEYYGVYNCNIAVELDWVKGKSIGNTSIPSTKKNDNYITTLDVNPETKDLVSVEKVLQGVSYTRTNIKFVDTDNSDLTNVNLTENPVKITFKNDKGQKVVEIKDKNKIANGYEVLLIANSEYSYTIESESLVFHNLMGNFETTDKTGELAFEYYYLANYVTAEIGLHAVGTVDLSSVNLAENPVTIVLNNNTHIYQFVFDDNSKLNSYQTMLVEIGTYSYSITSDQLTFISKTGSLTITSSDRIMLFNYILNPTTAQTLSATVSEIVDFDDPWYGSVRITGIDFGDLATKHEDCSSDEIEFYFYDSTGKITHSIKHMTFDEMSLQSYIFKTNLSDSFLHIKIYIDGVVYVSNIVDIRVEGNPRDQQVVINCELSI